MNDEMENETKEILIL